MNYSHPNRKAKASTSRKRSFPQLPSEENQMNLATRQPRQKKTWKDLYIAALLEADDSRLPLMIAEAERAITERSRALFSSSGDSLTEKRALEEAFYALQALKSCFEIHGTFAQAS
jgi:hypothetical protein